MIEIKANAHSILKMIQLKCHIFNSHLVRICIFTHRSYQKVLGKYNIVMLRHGESEWNKKNLFCGWYDSKLTETGKLEARKAGETLKAEDFKFNLAFTSALSRAQETLRIILEVLDLKQIKVVKSWRLNERHYGGLTGLNKTETAEIYGEKQVAIWRRSFDVPPPPMETNHRYYKAIVNYERYKKNGPKKNEFPMYESLQLTMRRTLPFWRNVIVPEIERGKSIIIAAHGNSLRGIVKHLDRISDTDIMELNLPTGIPFLYALDENLKPVFNGSLQFLGDPETVRKAMESVAAQGKIK